MGVAAVEAEVADVVIKIVSALAPETEVEVTREVSLREQLGYHSLALVELGFLIEDAFGLEPIPREMAELVRTPGDIVDYVRDVVVERGELWDDDGARVADLLDELAEWSTDW